jgi:uncharacterized protein YwgA
MNETQAKVVLTALIESLRERGSWCGETHVQKNAYFLKELLGVPFEYDFILYKHGPFSFELRDELTGMRADGLLELEARPYPYGPSLVATDVSLSLEERFPKTLATYKDAIDFVTDHLGSQGVVPLERLATALMVTRETKEELTVDERARRLTALKPHVSIDAARRAVEEVDSMVAAIS